MPAGIAGDGAEADVHGLEVPNCPGVAFAGIAVAVECHPFSVLPSKRLSQPSCDEAGEVHARHNTVPGSSALLISPVIPMAGKIL